MGSFFISQVPIRSEKLYSNLNRERLLLTVIGGCLMVIGYSEGKRSLSNTGLADKRSSHHP